MNQNLKKGDKVRFLSEIGGGHVSGFRGKDIVLVEDEDGFEVPMQISEVVLIGDYDTAHVVAAKQQNRQKAAAKTQTPALGNDNDEPKEKPITFQPQPYERKGGDQLSAYLAFVPEEITILSSTRFEAYIVNDSNYFVRFAYLTSDGANWMLKETNVVEPNTKQFIEDFGREDLNNMNRVCIQLFAYKRDKPFMLKPALDIQLRIDGVKFYKLHTFQENDFFEQKALIYPLIENDKPAKQITLNVEELKNQLFQPSDVQAPKPRKTAEERKPGDPIVIDLHADQLLETTQGMSPTDILNYQLDIFKNALKEHQKEKGTKIVFIHGKGEGILRRAMLNELQYRWKKFTFQDASFQEYGYGATQVNIR